MNQSPSAASIAIEKTPAAIIARVQTKLLDEAAMTALSEQIESASGDGAPALVVIDLAKVEFLPSLCLGALVQIANGCRSRQQKVKLAALRPTIRKTFSITRLDRVFELIDSV